MKLALLLAACLPMLPAAKPVAKSPYQVNRPVQKTKRLGVKPVTKQVVCGDLLQHYATRPAGVLFVSCAPGEPGGQTVATATYRVCGADFGPAERFFHERYGMANLTFVCCGWEPAQGRAGQVASTRLRQLNLNYTLLITMYSEARSLEQAMLRGDASAWRDKHRVKQFIVEVKLVNV